MDFTGKVVFVTGASRGIGEYTAAGIAWSIGEGSGSRANGRTPTRRPSSTSASFAESRSVMAGLGPLIHDNARAGRFWFRGYRPNGGHQHFPVAEGGLPVSEHLAQEVISLPMHAYLDEPTQDRIVAAVRQALGG